MTVSDFNPDVGTVTVDGKTGKRHVVLTDEGQSFFKSVTRGKIGDALIFSNASGNSWGKSHQFRPMADACRNARISPAISFHILRHTWASLSVMNNVALMVVAKNLGHSDTRMVELHYGHLSPSFVADAIRAGAPRFGMLEPSNVQSISEAGA